MSLWNKISKKERDPSNRKNISVSQNDEDTLEDNLNQDPSSNFCGLFNLSKNESLEDLNIDIIAIHGLTGNWRQTWTHHNGACWLTDFLPVQFPSARIMAYGYNGDIFFSKAVTDIKQEAEMLLRYLENNRQRPEERKRPILLIGHSLGGILVKKAVIIAHEQVDVYGQLLNSIRGVIFFAVPHRGVELANLVKIFSKVVGFFGFGVNTKHVALLSKESDPLMDISSQFKNRARRLDIITFTETDKYKGHLIVGPNSSRLELANEQVCGIPGSDHRSICKFDSIESPKYQMVWKAIERLMQKYLETRPETEILEVPVEEHITYNPTKYTCPHFTGREEYLRQLARFFKPRNRDDVPSRREFLLHGIGGAGKTQICLKFAEEYSKLFWKVFWVDATNQDTLELGFQEIGFDEVAKRDGVDGSTDSAKRWLSRARKEWLLILDNADWDSTILDDYIPNGGRGNILFSSRNPSLLHRIKNDGAMEVAALGREDAKRLLGKIMHLDDMTIKDEDLHLGSIVDELYCIALAIDHAGAAILSGLCSLSDYTEKLKKHRRHLLANTRFRGAPGYNNTLYSTWSLTTTLLEERARLAFPDTSPERVAIQLLNLFAFFHNNSIMEETFRRAVEALNSNPALGAPGNRRLPVASEFLPTDLLQTDMDGKWDSLVFREGIQILWSFSILQRDKTETTYSMHPLVHLWSRERLNQREQNTTCLAMYAILSASIGYDSSGHDIQYSASIGYTSSSHDFQYCRRVVPHLRALRQAMTESKINENFFDDAFSSFWHVFAENGLMKEAEHFASELIKYRTRELGDRHERTLLAVEYLTDTLLKSGTEGTLGRSILLLEDTYRLRIETLGEDHPATLRSKILLGITHHIDGNYKKAEEQLNDAWHSAVSHLGETHPSSLRAAEHLSSVYSQVGYYVRAEEIQQKILETMLINFGDEDLRTIDAMANLAVTVTKMGRLDESETLKLQIADLRTKKMGMYHPDTIMAYSNLAATYGRQNRWKEAENVILEVIERRVEVLGELHRETLRARLILTRCLEAQGRLLEAEAQCKILLEGRKVVIGETHADTLWSMHQLASIYAGQGRLEEAIDLWERTVAMQRENKSLGESYWETQETMHCLACALHRHGQKEEAILLMEHVLELKRKRLPNGEEDPTILASQKALFDWKTE